MKKERPSILIVEGENAVDKNLPDSLTHLGYRVAGVIDPGREAIQVAEQVRPDLALMEISFEGCLSGLAIAGEIRNRLNIPIIFLAEEADRDTIATANAIAPYGYLLRPFSSTELDTAISIAINQHRLVQATFAEQAWLTTMLRSVSDAVIATDDHGCVRFLNPPAEALTGWTLREAFGLPIEDIYDLATLDGQRLEPSKLRKVLRLRHATPRERFLLKSRIGFTVPIEDSAAPIAEQGHVLGAVTIFRDITDVLDREDKLARERDQAKEQVEITAEALGQTRSNLRSLSEHLINSHEEERRRLARSLHDNFSQRTALLGLQIDHLSADLRGNDEAQKRLEAMRTQVAALSDGLRATSRSLHPSVLTDLGFVPALRTLAEHFIEAGVDVSVRAKESADDEIPANVATALYRIAEEAIRNAVKHTESAAIRIVLSSRDGHLHMSIEDAGSGFDLVQARARGGLGILSMQERARMIGGSLFIRTADGQGTQVLVRVPLV